MKTKTILKTSKILYLKLTALLLLVTVFASCRKSSDDIVGTAYLQIVNADASSSPQDFYLDDKKLTTTSLAYTESTAFIAVTSADHQAQFKDATGTSNISFPISPAGNGYYSLYYLGGKAAAYANDPTTPLTGKARVRFINLSTSVTGNVDFGITGGVILSAGLAQYVASNYYDLDLGTKFSVYTSGSTSVLLNIPFTLEAGKIYTIYATGAGTLSYRVVVGNP